jgi:hypothetical protein
VVIDSDVRICPAGAVAAVDAIFENSLSDLPEAPQLLDIQMNKVTDSAILIAIRSWPWLAAGA